MSTCSLTLPFPSPSVPRLVMGRHPPSWTTHADRIQTTTGTAVEGQLPEQDDTNGERVVEYRFVRAQVKLTVLPLPLSPPLFYLWFSPPNRKKAAEEAALKK